MIMDSSEVVELDARSLGVVADIHANPYALDAVLSHGADNGVERWLVLGDVVAMGPEPRRVLDQLREVDVVAFIAGNTERYVLTGDRPDPSFAEVAADPSLLPRLTEVAASFAWTKGFLQASDSLERIREFRPTVRLRFPDGTNCIATHASLVADDGQGIEPGIHSADIASLFPDTGAEIILGGHTHLATDVTFGGRRFVNPGSVSNHHEPHLDALYAIMRLGEDGHRIEHHTVGYDKRLVIESIATSGIPGASFLLGRYFAGVA